MKRLAILLLSLCLCLSLAACGEKPAAGSETIEEPEETATPATLEKLRVEFVVGERDTDALLTLRTDFPPLLIDALAEEGVAVGAVEVTFGTSGDATARAVRDGSVDLAFLPSEAYLENEDGLYLLALEASVVLLSDDALAEIDGVDAGSVFYPEAVVLSDDALAEAFTAALLHLCTTSDGSAALQCYGCGAYLTEPAPDTLLAPYRAYLTWMAENK